MLIIAHHNINEPEKFWQKAQTINSEMPSHFKLHSVYPSKDGKTGTCLWEAPAAEEVQKFLDDTTGSMAKNYCYEVNEASAIGIPRFSKEAINN